MGNVGGYKIWLAQYSAEPTYKGRYDMWQYSSKGKISGINGNVDLNLLDSDKLMKRSKELSDDFFSNYTK